MMGRFETNVFPIMNLHDLKSRYRMYYIRGLAVDQEEYDHNVQTLIGKLSRMLRSPVTVINWAGQLYLVLPEDAQEPAQPFLLVRATAYFEPTGETLSLDYSNPTPETEQICLRFLQFALEGALFGNREFWQPSAGHPFFQRVPVLERDGVCVYRGYAIRVVRSNQAGFGVCVDVTHKYVGGEPLPAHISRDEFRRYKGARCVYHFGLGWYEIRLHDHSGLSVKEQMIESSTGKPESLYDYIMQNARKPLPKEVLELSPESVAVRYLTSRGEVRHAAAALCYPVFDTSDSRIRHVHRETILQPQKRRSLIHAFVRSSLREIHTGRMVVRVSPTPVSTPKNVLPPPDLAFGNRTVVSVRGAPGATHVSLNRLGQERLSALYNHEIGPYTCKPLDRQYLVIPQSVADSYGPAFIDDLKKEVNALYPQELPYDPTIITYNDRVPKTFVAQGTAILGAVEAARLEPGFGVVMIHETERRQREHDQLAAMLMHELRKRQLYMSIIHTTVPSESYGLVHRGWDGPAYEPLKERERRLKGYLRNVAINKVLLTNECWPFVLATPLNADLTVTIDVRNHTACFTFMGKSGPEIRTELTDSREKEKLTKAHVKRVLLRVLRQEALLGMTRGLSNIVVQRDGRVYTSEIAGVKEAIEMLKKERQLPATASVNFVEIHKRSAAPFRLFDVRAREGGWESTENPSVGSYHILNSQDAYVCSTGREFNHPGTSKPLHIKYVEGSMPLRQIVEDIYAQTCLALTRPEDCSRLPFTLKLTDIRLTEHAGEYDEDALAFVDEEYGDGEPSPESDEVYAHE